jgi:hypothetical protein
MNRIILIGNGFDLAYGLHTSYANFIDDFWKCQFDDYNQKATSLEGIAKKQSKNHKFII